MIELNLYDLWTERSLDLGFVILEIEHPSEHVPDDADGHCFELRVDGDHIDVAIYATIRILIVDAACHHFKVPMSVHLSESRAELYKRHQATVSKHPFIGVLAVELIPRLRCEQ